MRTIRNTGFGPNRTSGPEQIRAKRANTRVRKPLGTGTKDLRTSKGDADSLNRKAASYLSERQDARDWMFSGDSDSLIENVLEFVDPTGITSHDDARRAYESMRQRGAKLPDFNEFVDMLGAVPVLGKLGKAGKATQGLIEVARQSPKYMQMLMRLVDGYDSVQDVHQDNVPGMQMLMNRYIK